ncbi:exonuclease family protein, partial [Vibrio parahaemolyticus V-223/04]
SDSFFIMRF